MNDRHPESAAPREQRTLWQEAWRRFKKNKLALLSLAFLLLLAGALSVLWFGPALRSR